MRKNKTIGLSLPETKFGKSIKSGAVSLVEDGVIKFASSEERFTRKKYDSGFKQSLQACMSEAGVVSISEIDQVVVSSCCEPVRDPEEIASENDELRADNLTVIPHHLSHAYSAYHPSPFNQALIIVMDAGGNVLESVEMDSTKETPWTDYSREQFTVYEGCGSSINRMERDFTKPKNAGFGEVYRAFTYYLGWPSYAYSANTMALAAFGDPNKFSNLNLFKCDNGRLVSKVENDPSRPIEMLKKTAKRQGVNIPPPRQSFAKYPPEDLPNEYSHLAARLQYEFENALTEKVKYLIGKTGITNLCIAGGVGLNCVANRKVLDKTKVSDIFIQPAAGDDGQALGNALFGYQDVYSGDTKNQEEKFLPYLGPTYDLSKESLQDRNYFQDALIEHDLSFKSIDNPAEKASRMIAGGSVVAWFQGRSEYGPRALGNRSILADPRSADNKAKCHSVKEHREPHRPFSPSVIYSQAQNFFAVERETPYMITVSDVLPDKKEEIPAVVHADGTSRLQTVTKKDNARFYALLQEFYANTGIPLVLNTSFNLSGDPIVESPEDALRTFLRSTLDALFVGDVIIKRK